jgi:4-amino-4-deoxy-L-arabinose transferase-like glycosyltransferase
VNKRMTSKNHSRQADAVTPLPWLTIEFTLWGLLLIIALGLRLLRLDAAPLSTIEARDALAAWRFATGGGAPTTTGYSPALFSGQWFIFLIFGASDLAARLLPALAGGGLVLTPVLLRQQLGRLGALAAGTLLALSPTALALSRTASGDVLVALGALLCVVGFWSLVEHQRVGESANTQDTIPHPPTVYLAPLGIALMWVSGSLAYSALIGLGSALVLVAFVDAASRRRLYGAWRTLRTAPNLASYALVALLGSAVLLSTAFAWHFGGLAAAADLLPQWLGGFVRWSDSLSIGYPALILIFYDPLILLLGGAGVVWAAIRGHASSLFMALWSIVALLLALIRPGHGPGDVLLVLVPLACLGGRTFAALLQGLRRWGHWLNEGLFLAVSTPLWVYLLLNLATYSSRPAQYSQINLFFIHASIPTFLSLVAATMLMLLILATGIGLIQGSGAALRSVGSSVTLALLLFTIATMWGVSQNRPADPRELLVLEPTAGEVRLLRENLDRLSTEHRKGVHGLDLTLLTDDPALTWSLRDFQEARVAHETDTLAPTSAVIAPQTPGTPPLAGDYVGQSFPLRRRWSIDRLACGWSPVQIGFDQVRQLDCSGLVRWFVFRRSPEPPLEEKVVLWLRQDLVTGK